MQRKNPNVWTVHTSKGCLQTKEVKCYVPLTTEFKQNGRQPKAKLKGSGAIYIGKDSIYIVDNSIINLMSDDDYFEATSAKLFK